MFIRPDRSAEQRAEHKKLVIELKRRSKEEPGKKHFIKGGELFSVEKK